MTLCNWLSTLANPAISVAYFLYIFLDQIVSTDSLKDDLYISGTCGNGLKCDSRPFYEIDCFNTLLTNRCSYGASTTSLAIFITLSIVLIFAMLVLCVIFRRCGWQGVCYFCIKLSKIGFLAKFKRQSNRHTILTPNDQFDETHFTPINPVVND